MTHLFIFFSSFAASLLVAALIISTGRLHGHLSHDSHPGVQKLHVHPTPRIGGLALMAGMLAGGLLLSSEDFALWQMVAVTALPAFLFGLIEDITKRVGVRTRLLATIGAGLAFCIFTGYRIDHVNIYGIDLVLGLPLVAVLFTAVAIGGIANAINIIDGVNGLASGTAIIILSGFAILAWQTSDDAILALCLVAMGALGGFFLLNFPLGKIFLGDAGAYAAGFVLAVVAVMLPARNPEISPLLGLLALSYPVTETIVSIHRRIVREGSHPGQPDRLHLHSLVYRSRALRVAQLFGVPHLRNAVAGLLTMVLPLVSMALMVVSAQSEVLVLLSLLAVSMVYLGIYRRVALLKGVPALAGSVMVTAIGFPSQKNAVTSLREQDLETTQS